MTGRERLWEFVPDHVGRRRRARRVRLAVALAAAVLVVAALRAFGSIGVMVVAVAVIVVVVLVESWLRTTPDSGPQRLWVEKTGPHAELHAEGPDVYVRAPADDGFERVDEPPVVDLAQAVWMAVYPAMTREDVTPTPPPEFHLVVDVALTDGSRRCLVFDRRLPFRLAGELDLVDAVRQVAGDRWRGLPVADVPVADRPVEDLPAEDLFGGLDETRWHDWVATGR